MFTQIVEENQLLLVSLSQLKDHCRIEHNDDDALLDIYLIAAHYAAGEHTRRRMFATKAAAFQHSFLSKMFLPGGSVRNVTSVKATDENNNQVDVNYTFHPIARYISFDSSYSNYKDFEISYECGYLQNNAPKDICVAIMMIAATMYEIREDISYGVNAFEIPFTSMSLLKRHVLPNSQADF